MGLWLPGYDKTARPLPYHLPHPRPPTHHPPPPPLPPPPSQKAIAAFQHDPPTTVFLLSMRAGAVGINLTAANHVFLLEPALNPALEAQAIGRAWRMGQKRPVTVKRLYVKGSIEERIMRVVADRSRGEEEGAGGEGAPWGVAGMAAMERMWGR